MASGGPKALLGLPGGSGADLKQHEEAAHVLLEGVVGRTKRIRRGMGWARGEGGRGKWARVPHTHICPHP